ncbi:MAG: uroporphyrinogen-III synthase [archaeon]|nr:uroporphyrinogen-III synthase [archaeon]MCP8313393.1 uroporphyrinogen-III synthase [archaeon]MCP8316441.1 uroporphyrinogen-III synthase [archaeon]MCP8322542.1 uroporphyrinogen-III synthase [archaeon]
MVQDAFMLRGRTIAITRPLDQAKEACKMIEEKGGKPYLIPTVEIKGPSDLSPIKKFIEDLMKGKIDYVIFMSINGVRYLLNAAESLRLRDQLIECLEKTITIAVGPRTAHELKAHQIHVDLVPEKYSSEGIIQSLQQFDISGKLICIPRTRGATPTLEKSLRKMGAKVQEVYVYESLLPIDQNIKERFFQDLISGKIHAIIFSSSLCVKNLFQILMEQISMEKLRDIMNSRLTIVAIGPATAKTLCEMGVKVDIMPDKHLFEEALIALARYWNAS